MFDKNSLGSLMKQAKKMQDKMAKVQEEIADIEVTGESGAGLVKITLNGIYNCRGLKIDHTVIKNEEKEVLEDLIIAAFNDAIRKISIMQKEKMQIVSSKIPPII